MRALASAVLLISVLFAGCSPHPRLIGLPAPDFTVKDPDHTVSLHDFRGKKVVLNFWTSWCKPCVDEMPSLIQLQKQMGARITVLAVSWDEDEASYRRFLRQYNVDLLTAWDPRKMTSDLYGCTGQPETYIIDPSGTVRRKFVGQQEWNSLDMIEYLNKL